MKSAMKRGFVRSLEDHLERFGPSPVMHCSLRGHTARTFPVDKSEPNWGKAHGILMPAFGPKSIQSMLPNMLDIGARQHLGFLAF